MTPDKPQENERVGGLEGNWVQRIAKQVPPEGANFLGGGPIWFCDGPHATETGLSNQKKAFVSNGPPLLLEGRSLFLGFSLGFCDLARERTAHTGGFL